MGRSFKEELVERILRLEAEVARLKTVETPLAQDAIVREYAIVRDEKSSGTNGGDFNSGAWRTRDLNTVVVDEVGITLASNQITLPAGTYVIKAAAPAYRVGRHKTRWRNVDDGTTVLSGGSSFCGTSDSTQTNSVLFGEFTISAEKTFEFQHRGQTTHATFGFGIESGTIFTVDSEIYAQVVLIRVG